jgi:hypothetical protein
MKNLQCKFQPETEFLGKANELQKLSRRPGPAKRKLFPEGRQDTERERDESIPRTEKASGQGT